MFSKLMHQLNVQLSGWFGELFIIFVCYIAVRLTTWGMWFADRALDKGSDLTGAAAILAAVGALPLGLLTLVATNYIKMRANTPDADSPN